MTTATKHALPRLQENPRWFVEPNRDARTAVQKLYRRAKAVRGETLWPSTIATRLLGRENVVSVEGKIFLGTLVNRERIEIRSGLSRELAEETIGHELGHLVRGKAPRWCEVDEDACDRIAFALMRRVALCLRAAAEREAS